MRGRDVTTEERRLCLDHSGTYSFSHQHGLIFLPRRHMAAFGLWPDLCASAIGPQRLPISHRPKATYFCIGVGSSSLVTVCGFWNRHVEAVDGPKPRNKGLLPTQ